MSWYYSQLFTVIPYPRKSFDGQTVLVTGSNVGLGFEAARHFARLGASKVILAVRNAKAGEEAKLAIEESTKKPGCCEVWELDLSSFASVKAFGERASKLARLDVLVENASIANPATFAVEEGHERHITVNVISTFLLALLLLPKMQQTAKSFKDSSPRLTIVTSEMHKFTEFPEQHASDIFAALDDAQMINMAERYNTSKLLQILLGRELAARITGKGVTLNMINPGLCHSSLARDYGWDFWLFKCVFARRTEMGSRTILAGASAGTESHGTYMSDGIVCDSELSSFVKSEEGAMIQGKLWSQLTKLLEAIAPQSILAVA